MIFDPTDRLLAVESPSSQPLPLSSHPVILLLGKSGQIGWELRRNLLPLGEVVALSHADLDLADLDAARAAVRDVRPDAIVNAAGFTKVDDAENALDACMGLNRDAPRVLAEEARDLGALLVHFSTDYVFDGAKTGAYSEEDTPAPVNVYGRSKLAGDEAIRASGCDHAILRSSWVYGSRGSNFFLTVLKLAQSGRDLRVVDDQVGSPTPARLVADVTGILLDRLLRSRAGGFREIFNVACEGGTSWFRFAEILLEQAWAGESMPCAVVPVESPHRPDAAVRPRNSRLSTRKIEDFLGLRFPDWQTALQTVVEEYIDRRPARVDAGHPAFSSER